MDLRNLTNKAADRIKSVFSKDNRFFYGTPEHQEEDYQQDAGKAPVQGTYPNTFAQGQHPQPSFQGPYQQQPQPGYQQQFAYPQQPMGQQAPYAQQQAPYAQQQPYQQQPQQPQAWQAQPYVDPGFQQQQTQAYASPQQTQLNQQMDAGGRNRRAAQHVQSPQQQPDNIVPFPGGAPEQEIKSMDAYVVNVTNINGCRQAMSCLRKGQCTLVVMDQLVDKAEVRRYVDMLNGACFALGGTMTRLSVKVGFYILAPSGMMVYTDPITASANAPARPQPQMQQGMQQPAYQQQPVYQQAPYQPQPYQQQQPAPQAYAQQPQQQNPYAPPMQQQEAAPAYHQEPHNAQRYAQ